MKKLCGISAFAMIMTFTGCAQVVSGNPVPDDSISQVISDTAIEKIKNAKTVYDISEQLTFCRDYMKYSECENDEQLMFYFDVLNFVPKNYYYIAECGGEKYLLFIYEFADYVSEMTAVNGIAKSMNGGRLELSVDKSIEAKENDGCFPNYSYACCIVKLERDFDELIIDGSEFSRYSGGYIRTNNLVGIADAELNIIVPIKYRDIREVENYRNPDEGHQYYSISTDECRGLMDGNFNIIVEPEYNQVYIADSSHFIVEIIPENKKGFENCVMSIVNLDGEIIHDYVDGFIEGYEGFNNYANQAIFSNLKGGNIRKGVIDSELNVIIPPDYKDIVRFELSAKQDIFYVVETDGERFAVIDSSGVQQTEFEKSSVYDVKEKYYEMHR